MAMDAIAYQQPCLQCGWCLAFTAIDACVCSMLTAIIYESYSIVNIANRLGDYSIYFANTRSRVTALACERELTSRER
jgi:hypothetical protein